MVDEVRLRGLRLAVARVSEGRYDISDLLDKWMQPKDEPPSDPPHFSVNNIQLIGGKIEFDDQPKGKVSPDNLDKTPYVQEKYPKLDLMA